MMATSQIDREDIIKYFYYVLYEVVKAYKKVKIRLIIAVVLLLAVVISSFLIKYSIHDRAAIIIGVLEILVTIVLIWYIIKTLIKLSDYKDIENLTTRYLRRIDNYTDSDNDSLNYMFSRYIKIVSRELRLRKSSFLKLIQERRLGVAL
jgi:hypothetical protein